MHPIVHMEFQLILQIFSIGVMVAGKRPVVHLADVNLLDRQ